MLNLFPNADDQEMRSFLGRFQIQGTEALKPMFLLVSIMSYYVSEAAWFDLVYSFLAYFCIQVGRAKIPCCVCLSLVSKTSCYYYGRVSSIDIWTVRMIESCADSNFLVSRPTNHLDMESIDALVEAIRSFQGGLMVVSHDQYFITNTCRELWVIGDGHATRFRGDFDEYKKHTLEKTRKRVEASVKRLSEINN